MNKLNVSSYMSQFSARNFDKEWFKITGVTRLMEIAGFGVSRCILECYPLSSFTRPLIISGPGNNGGDGIVTAKFLKSYGYNPSIMCPKPSKIPYYTDLLDESNSYGVNHVHLVDDSFENIISKHDFVIDCIFGFSYNPPLRSPFDEIIPKLCSINIPIVSIDVPSGWPIDSNDIHGGEQDGNNPSFINPETLISITWPKICSKNFLGKNHYLVQTFPPQALIDKYHLDFSLFDRCSIYNKIN